MDKEKRMTKRTLLSAAVIFLLVPATIFAGVWLLDNRKYNLVSVLLIVFTMLPFFISFEHRKPQPRELVVIASLAAIAVAGRGAFFMLPQFKPVAAIVIIAGVCFGPESGFLVGAMAAFVSNFFFGQGPWTPWQMFCFGIIGFLAGVIFGKGILPRTRAALCVYGGAAVLFLYGGIMNPCSVLMAQGTFTLSAVIASYITGFWPDVVHAGATVIFLFLIARPMMEKLDRVRIKYGLIEER